MTGRPTVSGSMLTWPADSYDLQHSYYTYWLIHYKAIYTVNRTLYASGAHGNADSQRRLQNEHWYEMLIGRTY